MSELPSTHTPEELSRQPLAAGRVLELVAIDWRDRTGAPHRWESAERIGGRGAVLVIPRLLPSDRLLLIRQFRPPARGMVLEFPAGLIDEGEAAEAAALRELEEETGYTGAVRRVLPPAFNSPGLSGETVCTVLVDVDEHHQDNHQPRSRAEASEFIEVVRVPRAELARFCESESAAGVHLDSKVVAYALGGL